MASTQDSKKPPPKNFAEFLLYASREEQENSLRDKLQEIASEILVDAGFTIHSNFSQRRLDFPHNIIAVSYSRSKAKGVAELNGSLEGKIEGESFDLSHMIFDYRIKSEMNYFANFPERHGFRMSTSGTRVTEDKLKNAFRDYISKVVLGHKEFFDKLEE